MESRIDQGKRRYDLSMSRRTRKAAAAAGKAASPDRPDGHGHGRRRVTLKDSLREGSVEEEVGVGANSEGGEAVADRGELASAEEEKPRLLPAGEGKHHQMVTKVHGSGAEGVKLVTRCVKVLHKLVNARSARKKEKSGALFLR